MTRQRHTAKQIIAVFKAAARVISSWETKE